MFVLLVGCSPARPNARPTPSQLPIDAPTATPTLDPEISTMIIKTTGAITNIHDPTMIKEGNTYYLFSTGPGITIHCSTDMKLWNLCGRVFGANPGWATEAIKGVKDLWAPDIVFYKGSYYLYYAASTFGSNRSAIGLVTNTTLDPQNPKYDWVDQGEVISSSLSDNFNAIDPNLVFDQVGQPWLVFGSFWSGVKLVKLDPSTLKPASGEKLISLAAKPGSDAVEGAFITQRGDFYYLFVSHDYCCQGVMSSYNIRVGRSSEITGPYTDRDGKLLTQGGGTLVYKGSNRWRGPGHNSIYIEAGQYYMVYHSYDAEASGVPTLRIEILTWDLEGWPLALSALMGK